MQISDFMTVKLDEEPSLAPAVKHLPTNRIYRGQPGQMHHDVAKDNGFLGVGWKLDPRLQLGFINHKGHFLDRTRALDYAKHHDMLHDMARRYIATDDAPHMLGASFLKN